MAEKGISMIRNMIPSLITGLIVCLAIMFYEKNVMEGIDPSLLRLFGDGFFIGGFLVFGFAMVGKLTRDGASSKARKAKKEFIAKYNLESEKEKKERKAREETEQSARSMSYESLHYTMFSGGLFILIGVICSLLCV